MPSYIGFLLVMCLFGWWTRIMWVEKNRKNCLLAAPLGWLVGWWRNECAVWVVSKANALWGIYVCVFAVDGKCGMGLCVGWLVGLAAAATTGWISSRAAPLSLPLWLTSMVVVVFLVGFVLIWWVGLLLSLCIYWRMNECEWMDGRKATCIELGRHQKDLSPFKRIFFYYSPIKVFFVAVLVGWLVG